MRSMLRGFLILISFVLLGALAVSASDHDAANAPALATDAQRPELAYLKEVNRWRPPSDPQLIFLLMAQFANAGRYEEGIAYFEETRKRFDSSLNDVQRGLYLTALAALRAGRAPQVPLLSRLGWVRDTVKMLDEAKRLTGEDVFVSRWMSGVVRARLPAFFGERDAALADLAWCEAHADGAPHRNWLREVYAHLALLYQQRGDAQRAQRYRALGGVVGDGPAVALFTTASAYSAPLGHTFSPQQVREVIPGSVYTLSGFGFTEFHFIVSADRRELIAIDAGVRPDTARSALDALKAQVPSLPPLTTVLVTHAHWDHVGGHHHFRSLKPTPVFIGRANYRDELAVDAMAGRAGLQSFFGATFEPADVLDYAPDRAIERDTELTIGGTRIRLLLARGGETNDAMLVHLPEQGVLFVGDVLMPYLGAPFLPEGDVDGLLAAMDQVQALQPRVLLHGHEPLTRVFARAEMLHDLHEHLAWLREQVAQAMARGTERSAIQAANLMPPTLERSNADVHLAYLVLRENFINRVFQQRSGYWQPGLHGLDALGDADRGDALANYLHLTDRQVADAAQHLVADGKHEQAAEVLRWAQPQWPSSSALRDAQTLAHLKLMEKFQEFSPFKFILYSAQIERATAQIEAPANPAPR